MRISRTSRTRHLLNNLLSLVLLIGILIIGLEGCASGTQKVRLVDLPEPLNVLQGDDIRRLSGGISEVAPPAVLLDLGELLDRYEPQVAIASPKANQTLKSNQTKVKLKLKGLPIYKDEKLGIGPHIQLILDNQPAKSVYSLDDPILFEDLAPGSHTLRAVATKPWGESFKNERAYAQTTFHVLAETGENSPDADLPLITYLEPQGEYSAEPILLDFYLNNAPIHAIAQQNAEDGITDWKIRCSVNGQSFVFDQWQPIYLKGLSPGQNWVQLSLIDAKGHPIENVFNNTVHTFSYDPQNKDTLAKIVRGELPIEKVGQIAIPDYEPPVIPEPVTPEEVEPETDIIPDVSDSPEMSSDQEPESEDLSSDAENSSSFFEDKAKKRSIDAQDGEIQDTESQNSKSQLLEPEVPEPEVPEPEVIESDFEENSESDAADQPDANQSDPEQSDLEQDDLKQGDRDDLEQDDLEQDDLEQDDLEQDDLERAGFGQSDLDSDSSSNKLDSSDAEDDASEEIFLEADKLEITTDEDSFADESRKENIFSRFSQFLDSFKENQTPKPESPVPVPPLLEDDTINEKTDSNAVEMPELTEQTDLDSVSDTLLNDVFSDDDESNNDLLKDETLEDEVSIGDSTSTDEVIELPQVETPQIDRAVPSPAENNAPDTSGGTTVEPKDAVSGPQSFFSQLKERTKSFIQQSSSPQESVNDEPKTLLPEENETLDSKTLTPDSDKKELIPEKTTLLEETNLERDGELSEDDAFKRSDDFDNVDEKATTLPETLSAPEDISPQVIVPVEPDSLDAGADDLAPAEPSL